MIKGKPAVPNAELFGLLLDRCKAECDAESAPYLLSVQLAAAKLANTAPWGGNATWLLLDEIDALRSLPDFYPEDEAPLVARAVEVFLRAYMYDFYDITFGKRSGGLAWFGGLLLRRF